ncbi:hypothetical protein PHAVU_003G249200 [Phaseolus vulgaris]|uniref:Uncharacterized protein n=1 Tax=Phaseolus vulgaris TaxID=3885 RepID=V7CFC7_PHAVU|nr:hypothetical protein PHAVU_003G249200g [Phaseolus vulgaris]ESW27980.1 hypothetical protein PHAVU_003G249200g [Phaseolus vulgaris]
MAFSISISQSGFPEREKENLDKLGEKECATEVAVSSQLQLKSSKACSERMDKHAVLRRLRQRRSYHRAKSASEAQIVTTEADAATALEQKWLHLADSFSSP